MFAVYTSDSRVESSLIRYLLALSFGFLFPQIGHRTHFIVSIFFSILTSKYYPTKFIKFIATVFKFLLLDYLTAEKECFHIELLFTCHFFVFLILYPPVQQIA